MASKRHSAGVEPAELSGSTPQPTIPVPAPQPALATLQLAGPMHRHFQPRAHRPPFLCGREKIVLGQGAFSTVTLVCQIIGPHLSGARKVAIIRAPHLGVSPPSPYKDPN